MFSPSVTWTDSDKRNKKQGSIWDTQTQKKHIWPRSKSPATLSESKQEYRHGGHKAREIVMCLSESVWVCWTSMSVFHHSKPLIIQCFFPTPFNLRTIVLLTFKALLDSNCLPHHSVQATHIQLTELLAIFKTWPAHYYVIALDTSTWNALLPHFQLLKFYLTEHLFCLSNVSQVLSFHLWSRR